jgi:hypothetical protein
VGPVSNPSPIGRFQGGRCHVSPWRWRGITASVQYNA